MKLACTALLAAVAFLAARPAFGQGLAYSSIPIYSNGYVVSVPNSPAGAATTYFPGSTGASTFPTSSFNASTNAFGYNPTLMYNVGPIPANAPAFSATTAPLTSTVTPASILGTVNRPYGSTTPYPASNGMPGVGNGFNAYPIWNNMSSNPYQQGWQSGFYPWK